MSLCIIELIHNDGDQRITWVNEDEYADEGKDYKVFIPPRNELEEINTICDDEILELLESDFRIVEMK
jgi:hypothetical protein